MRAIFPLFNNPIDLAHQFWSVLIQDGDAVIDATCGNGKDSLFLSTLLKNKKNTKLFCLDIQKQALDCTKVLIQEKEPDFFSSIEWVLGSHEILPDVSPKPCKLIVYNLGYLPKADKQLTTKTTTTLQSIHCALQQVCQAGVICITCYPGHEEGKKEQTHLLALLSNLDPKIWSVSFTSWENRKNSPSLFLIQKSL